MSWGNIFSHLIIFRHVYIYSAMLSKSKQSYNDVCVNRLLCFSDHEAIFGEVLLFVYFGWLFVKIRCSQALLPFPLRLHAGSPQPITLYSLNP